MSKGHLQHLIEVNRTFADQIKTADQKAAYIFTFLLALIVWSAETRRAFHWDQFVTIGLAAEIASVALVGATLTALFAAICVVLPRSRPGRTVLFWGAWPEAGDRLEAARAAANEEFLFEDYLQNTKTLACICAAKYKLVSLAFRALLVVVVSYVALLVIG